LRAQKGHPEQPRRPISVYEVPKDQGIPIPVPAIVSEELFAAVAERLEENRKRYRQSQRGAKYLLQGLIVCARCDYAFCGRPVRRKARKGNRRNYVYYRCIGADAYRFGGERVCHNKQVRTDVLDEAVWKDRQFESQDFASLCNWACQVGVVPRQQTIDAMDRRNRHPV